MPPAAASLEELRGQPLSLGLDLGTTSLKVVLRARSGRWWLLHDGPAPLGPDPAAALDVLRAALAGCGVPGIRAQVTRVACTAHGQSALIVERTTLELVGAPIWWHDAAPPGPCPLGDGAVLPPAGSWQPARLTAAADHRRRYEPLFALQRNSSAAEPLPAPEPPPLFMGVEGEGWAGAEGMVDGGARNLLKQLARC